MSFIYKDTTIEDVIKEFGDDLDSKVTFAANYIASDLVSLLRDDGSRPKAKNFAKLMEMIASDTISSRGAKDILAIMVKEDDDPQKIAEENGLLQQSDAGALEEVVDKIIAANEEAVNEYKAGKEASLQFLIGQGMKETKGSANPQVLKEIFEKKLK